MGATARIYYLEHPVTKQPFYVGCTTKTLKERLYSHMHSSHVKLISEQNIVPAIELIEEVRLDVASDTECYWIWQFKAWGFNLSNKKYVPSHVRPNYELFKNDGKYSIKRVITADAAIKKFKTSQPELHNLICMGKIEKFKDFFGRRPIFCRDELTKYFDSKAS